MSEKNHSSPEQFTPSHEQIERHTEHESRHHGAQESTHEKQERLQSLRHNIKHEAISGHDLAIEKHGDKQQTSQPLINKELRGIMLSRTLTSIRKKLPVASRQFSKIVHAKPIETMSEIGEKTIARPPGLLFGGIAALVGSGITYYMAKHYGFRYNFLLFFLLFATGYIIGSIAEFLLYLVRGKRPKNN